ncbi:hypothetical protein EF405_03845 [Cyclobacteriaceae bacterium YHN15]|nr:hypothetical protein EF405_03845 [Cyclobacteriaceae bacterium YHN15]
MKKYISIHLLMVLVIISCNRIDPDQKKIEDKVHNLYAMKESIYEVAVDTSLFSRNLFEELNNLKRVRKMDEERIRKSEHPTDKPIMIEGSIFSSLIDGYSEYSIKEISIKDFYAEVMVEFIYPSDPVEKWQDKVILVNEKGWKIDDVIFSLEMTKDKNLKERIKSVN